MPATDIEIYVRDLDEERLTGLGTLDEGCNSRRRAGGLEPGVGPKHGRHVETASHDAFHRVEREVRVG